jgi:hypothetical protein
MNVENFLTNSAIAYGVLLSVILLFAILVVLVEKRKTT